MQVQESSAKGPDFRVFYAGPRGCQGQAFNPESICNPEPNRHVPGFKVCVTQVGRDRITYLGSVGNKGILILLFDPYINFLCSLRTLSKRSFLGFRVLSSCLPQKATTIVFWAMLSSDRNPKPETLNPKS